MPSVSVSAVLACLALGLPLSVAHAQAPTGFLYVGADKSQDHKGFGTATVSAFGTTAAGTYAFIEAAPDTTHYKGLSAFGTGQITVTGGTFQQLYAGDDGSINLVGTNLTQSADYQINSIGAYYTISGTLEQETDPFTAEWYVPSTGQLLFDGLPAIPGAAPIPEASTLISFALLLLGGAWLTVKRRKVSA